MKDEDDTILIKTTLGQRSKRDIERNKYNQWRSSTKEAAIYIAILYVLAGGKCPHCGCFMIITKDPKYSIHPNKATLDHITPLSKVLVHKKFGLQIMCYKCNNEKGDKIIV